MGRICRKLAMTRQNCCKARKARKRRENRDGLVLALVRQERAVNPRAGTKKLLAAIRPDLEEAGVGMGRNRLGALLKRNGLLVEKRKSFRCRTTRRDPALPPSPNLVRDMAIEAPNQAVCTDITYICTEEGFLYLSLAMDMFVRDIAGWAARDTLGADGPLGALEMAAETLGAAAGVVAHSDRGCQYASHAYREKLAELGWISSMTEERHRCENAKAERLDGMLKGECFLDRTFRTKAEAVEAIKEAVWSCNHRRLHGKLGYKTPAAFRREWGKEAA